MKTTHSTGTRGRRCKRAFIGAVPAAMLVATMAGPVPSAVAAARPQKAAPYTVYLSNNYLGNTWRVQMEKSAEAAATLAPLKGKVVLKVENVGQTVPAQITSLDAIIARHPERDPDRRLLAHSAQSHDRHGLRPGHRGRQLRPAGDRSVRLPGNEQHQCRGRPRR